MPLPAAEAFDDIRGERVVLASQSVLDGFGDQSLRLEPVAGPTMEGGDFFTALAVLQLIAQQRLEEMVWRPFWRQTPFQLGIPARCLWMCYQEITESNPPGPGIAVHFHNKKVIGLWLALNTVILP